jgi:hypothetical protein
LKRKWTFVVLAAALLALLPAVVLAAGVPWYEFATPVFGLAAAPDGSLLVADAGQGIVELRNGQGRLVAALPGVTDVAPIGRGVMFAITGGGEDASAGKLYRISQGNQKMVADLMAYEAEVNPDGGFVDSNPYGVAMLDGNTALVADAGGNSLLIVDGNGTIDWIATLPMELAPTDNVKALIGCPTDDPELGFVCGLPPVIPAEAVATSVAIGPDGAYYVGELKGFPGPVGMSKVWRIEPGTRHAECGTSPACSVAYSGFTSIVDLDFGPDGTLYVVEIDESSFLAPELAAFFGLPVPLGGTVNACSGGSCAVVLEALLPTAVAVDKQGAAYATVGALIPGMAQMVAIP